MRACNFGRRSQKKLAPRYHSLGGNGFIGIDSIQHSNDSKPEAASTTTGSLGGGFGGIEFDPKTFFDISSVPDADAAAGLPPGSRAPTQFAGGAKATENIGEAVTAHSRPSLHVTSPPKQASYVRGAADQDEAKLLFMADAALRVTKALKDEHVGMYGTQPPPSHVVQEDLRALGICLCQFFTEQGPAHRSTKKRQRTSYDSYDTSSLKHIPVALSILVSSLLDATDPTSIDRFASVEDVEADIWRMKAKPERFLFDPPPEALTGKLDFSRNKLFGRKPDRKKLRSAFDRVFIRKKVDRGLVILSGGAGVGKTALVKKLRRPLAERNGVFISINFEEKNTGQATSELALFGAFDDYCRQLVQGDKDRLVEVGAAVEAALGPKLYVLNDVMPNLVRLVGGWSLPQQGTCVVDVKDEVKIKALRKFIWAISRPDQPILILFDALERADKNTLDMIAKIVKDVPTRSILFVASFRDDEVAFEDDLTETLGGIIMAAVPTMALTIDNLDVDGVNELLSDILRLSPRLTLPLAEAIHSKTNGTPRAVWLFMQSLANEHMLLYSSASRRWEWDIGAITQMVARF